MLALGEPSKASNLFRGAVLAALKQHDILSYNWNFDSIDRFWIRITVSEEQACSDYVDR
jgi:hypothetical protein